MNSGVYKITNTVNSKVYYGSTVDFKKRFSKHKTLLKGGTHGNPHLQNAFDKYGLKVFKFEILHRQDETIMRQTEQAYLDQYWDNGVNCYNSRKKVDCLTDDFLIGKKHKNNKSGHVGVYKHRNKYVARLRDTMLGAFNTIEEASCAYQQAFEQYKQDPHSKVEKSSSRNLRGQANKGKSPTEETRRKIGASNKGKKLGHKFNVGKKHTEESKQLMSVGMAGNQNGIGNKGINRRPPTHMPTNTSGYVGVCWDKSRRKWVARCKERNLGYYETKESAYIARLVEEEILWGMK